MSEFTFVAGLKFFVVAFVVCLAMLHLLTHVAHRVNLLDVPGARKTHESPTPLVGGLGIFLSLGLVSLIFAFDHTNWSLLIWLAVVLAIGVIDDFADLSYKARLLIHLLVVVGIWLTDGLAVQSIGAIINPESVVTFSVGLAVVFTAIAVIGAVNAVNMIDGVDGLLGTLMFISLASLLLIPTIMGADAKIEYRAISPLHISAVLGAVVAFLIMNARYLRRTAAKVYMGDAGSTVLGFLLVYLLVDFTQGDDALFSPVVAGWILGVPLLDASAVILKRVLQKKSPVAPGRDHIHHLLMNMGWSVNQTVLILAVAQLSMISIATLVESSGLAYSDLALFWGFVFLVSLRVGATILLENENKLRTDMKAVGLKLSDGVAARVSHSRHRKKKTNNKAAA